MLEAGSGGGDALGRHGDLCIPGCSLEGSREGQGSLGIPMGDNELPASLNRPPSLKKGRGATAQGQLGDHRAATPHCANDARRDASAWYSHKAFISSPKSLFFFPKSLFFPQKPLLFPPKSHIFMQKAFF